MYVRNKKGYDCLDRVKLVMHWRSRACEMVDLIDLEQDRLDHIMPDQLKSWITEMMHQIIFPSREEIINDNYAVSSGEQLIHQMASHESSATCHHDPKTRLLQICGDPPREVERRKLFRARDKNRRGILMRGERREGMQEEEGGGDERA